MTNLVIFSVEELYKLKQYGIDIEEWNKQRRD